MAGALYYANPGGGPLSGAIGWIYIGQASLASGASLSGVTATLRDGSVLTFNISNTPVSGATTPINMQVPFGTWTTQYSGITGAVGMYSNVMSPGGTTRITISNISLVDRFGTGVPNYYIYAVDAENTRNAEGLVFRSNGSPWTLFTTINPGSNPTISGLNTTTVTITGVNSLSYQSFMVVTKNPTQVSGDLIMDPSGAGASREGAAFGISINEIILNKVITGRYNQNDQFNLSVTGVNSATTTTYGNTYGNQPVSAYVIPATASLPNTFTLNEAMDPSSTSTLSQYKTSIAYTNLTPGGTTVPTSTAIPGTVTLNAGDIILATITNSIFTPTITTGKAATSFANIGDLVTYTLTFNNSGPGSVSNFTIIDTIPNGGQFSSNSLVFNGNSITGNPSPPSGVNVGLLPTGVSTLTFKVLVTTIPVPNPMVNTASSSYVYGFNPTTLVAGSQSNSANTQVNIAILSSSKQVNKNYGDVGDILTYTIPITNSGNVTANNVLFIDTIPSGTSLVSGSFKQDGVAVAGSPNPPGATLANIAPGRTSTIVFQVKVDTIPSPNPIPNSAVTQSTYTVDPSIPNNNSSNSSTNIVNTQINNASLGGITKSTDKSFADCGDLINYTIVIPNSGNVTAQNIVFRDTIPNGTVFVANSVFINGAQQTGANPATGISVPNIAPGATTTLTFQVRVQC